MSTTIQHYIDGRRSPLASTRTADVFNPSTGKVQAQVLLASVADVDTAVASAVAAQQEWGAWNPQRRARVMMKFVDLVNANAKWRPTAGRSPVCRRRPRKSLRCH